MGRWIALTLVFYLAFLFSRILIGLFKGSIFKTHNKFKESSSKPPWHEEDIEDADFEEIE